MATLDQEIADFAAFAKALSDEHGQTISLDDAYRQWREIDPQEAALLKQRCESYLAEGPGEPTDKELAELREKLVAKHGDS